MTPKTAVRLGRFDRARRDLVAPGPVPLLADLAARHGFYDQAHLAREFRDLAGLAPRAWLAETTGSADLGPSRRFVQAEPAEPLALSRS